MIYDDDGDGDGRVLVLEGAWDGTHVSSQKSIAIDCVHVLTRSTSARLLPSLHARAPAQSLAGRLSPLSLWAGGRRNSEAERSQNSEQKPKPTAVPSPTQHRKAER